MSKRAIRIATALALVAVMSVIAASLLMTDAGGATAFNAGASDGAARHMPIPAQYTAQCSNGVAVPNPASNPGLVADCAALLASKDALEGTTGNLNWSADRAISDWQGVSRANNGIVISTSRVSGLYLYVANLNGRIPAELGNLANLRSLHISGTDLTGTIPAELGNLANLTILGLDNNDLTGAIPAELGNLANLDQLWLNGNELTGAIPAQVGSLANLTTLSLDYNGLAGEIPAQLGNLANLKHLSLNNNELTGEIPAQLGNLANLTTLILDFNGLTGEIPTQLGNLQSLDYLHLNNNKLTGAIPSRLGNLADLGALRLHNNKLTGAIPAELGNLRSLDYLSLHGNQFTGCIPRSLRDTKFEFALAEPIGLPFCAATTPDTTPTPTATPAASNDVINRLIADMADLKEQVSALATRVAVIEGGSGTGAATATPTPTATPAIVPGVTPSPTPTSVAGATPSPTPTSVAGTSGGNACITALAGSASVNGSWSSACLSANPPSADDYYARFYTFTLDAAARVTITLSSATAAPYLYLLDGAGTDGAVRLSNGDVALSVAITASLQPGAYTIEATTYYSQTPGDFTLELEIR